MNKSKHFVNIQIKDSYESKTKYDVIAFRINPCHKKDFMKFCKKKSLKPQIIFRVVIRNILEKAA